jgi:hypothetical protein
MCAELCLASGLKQQHLAAKWHWARAVFVSGLQLQLRGNCHLRQVQDHVAGITIAMR